MKKLIIALVLLFGGMFIGEFSVFAVNSSNSADKMSDKNGSEQLEVATFAGGCFWCMESPFEKLKGVKAAVSGYTGGKKENPTYKQVSTGGTDHTEAVQVTFDPKVVSYKELLAVFWASMDPTDAGGQFVDRGAQYRAEIFYHSEEQRKLAEESKQQLIDSKLFAKPIVTAITKASKYYPAEDYHQDYYKKNPIRYAYYRRGSGRDQFLTKHWQGKKFKDIVNKKSIKKYKKLTEAEMKEKLTEMQYKVTQKDGTEPPFKNEYWDNNREGIYVDIVSREPLFSSKDKYKSGTGWPSFTKPLVEENIVVKTDFKLIYPRKEVRSKNADSHLGHVFSDGPKPTGKRYCMNSAALRFIAKEDLDKEGYGEFAKLFE